MGFEVIPQVGCSGYRIDIGVVDPAEPGRFLLGVECDGATYHSAATARDRDRLRQQVLEQLGWRIHRIWSPDWVTRRDAETRRLKEAIEEARRAPAIKVGSDAEFPVQSDEEGDERPPENSEPAVAATWQEETEILPGTVP